MDASAKGALAILLSLADLFISVSFAHTSGLDPACLRCTLNCKQK